MKVQHERDTVEIHFVERSSVLSGLDHSFVITDANVSEHFSGLLNPARTLVIAPGEESKSFSSYETVLRWLATAGAQRSDTVVALGGGVIGDLAGFVAASYMRGIRFIQIPTTLLAQVDSSVGGKVGIDLPEGKNLVGAFKPPVEVRICIDLLRTIPHIQLLSGMAEVLKYGFIMAPEILELDPGVDLEKIVRRCVECKKAVVEADEYETKGVRAILNFGHTVGHAIETIVNYQGITHGEAISVGMVVEARIGKLMGITSEAATQTVFNCLTQHGLPTQHPACQHPEPLIELMYRDKKATHRSINMSLVSEVGKCELVKQIPVELISEALLAGSD